MNAQASLAAKPRQRLSGVDALRFIAFGAIVLLHTAAAGTSPAPDSGKFLDMLCRFAVPFFFIASGYFLGSKASLPRAALNSAKRVMTIFVIWLAVYMVLDISNFPQSPNLYYVRWLVLTGGPGYHLWFLSALAVCLLMVAFESVLFGGRFLIFIGLAFYLVGICLGELRHLVLPGLREIDIRTGPFFGLFFVAMGLQIARTKLRVPTRTCLVLVALGLALQLLEATVLYLWQVRGFADDINYYVGTIPLAFGVFMLSLNVEQAPAALARWGQMTLGLYCIHLAVIWGLNRMLPHTTFLQNVLVAAATVILSVALVSLATRVKAVRLILRVSDVRPVPRTT